MTRARVLVGVLALAVVAGVAGAQESYPTRPITLVAPFPPGGVADLTARPVAPALEKILKTPVGVVNKTGAAGGGGGGEAGRGEEPARRLHAAARAVLDLDHSRGRQDLRPAAGLHRRAVRPDCPGLRRPDGPGGPCREPVEDGPRIHRGRPEEAR